MRFVPSLMKAIAPRLAARDRIYTDSAIFDRAHIQIAIRNPALIEEFCLIEEDTGLEVASSP